MLSNGGDWFGNPLNSNRRILCMIDSLISLLIALVSALLIVLSFVVYIGF